MTTMRSLLLCILWFPLLATAQVLKPVTWKYTVAKSEVEVGQTVELQFKAKIENGWHLYSSDFDPNLGPIVTTINLKPHPTYKVVGGVKAINPKKKYDDIFGGDYTYFEGTGVFLQKIKVVKPNPKVEGSLAGQVCTDADGKCISISDDFTFKITTASTNEKDTEPVVADTSIDSSSFQPVKRLEAPPIPHKELNTIGQKLKERGKSKESSSIFEFMLFAFAAGLVALITPCVFPMIPMTVTFFTNSTLTRIQAIKKAFLYGISIVLIYGIIGLLISRINGPEWANILATHWAPNLIFFAVFFIFGLSFLGMFDIVLPASFVNKVDAQSEKGGFLGVFFMAFTLVLVSFSCTGPIVGGILVLAAGGEVLKPVMGMLSYSMAFAVPFTLFAMFPNWLNKLPKSGGWLNVIKVTLGFIELALGLKFLSVADQVYHWNLLDREIYIAIWFILFLLLGIYLLGKLRLPHDSETHVTTVPRLLLAVCSFSFSAYLLPGLFGAPLKALSGYLPPMATHDFDVPGIIRAYTTGSNKAENGNVLCEDPKYADELRLPHGLQGFFDYHQALNCAKQKNIPLFIDFTGHGCVNCREMEANVWADPAVLNILKNDYLVVALYVDDPTSVPADEVYMSTYDSKPKKTIGAQNADLQISRFNNNAQPFYVLLNPHTEEVLAQPIGYEGSIPKFVDFLKEGKANFKQYRRPQP